jgi:hypothetical protein
MLIVVGSIHGNEPAGVLALEQVVERLESESLLVRGDFLALVGNLSAVRSRQRFIDADLNRQWSPEKLARLGSIDGGSAAEDLEQKALLEEIHVAFARARGPITLLDLHTTSAEGHPFAVFADTIRSRHFARRFPLPAVLGLEENLVGTLVDYVGLLGHIAVGFEGGQHLNPRSVSNLGSIVWMALGELGIIDPNRCTWIEELREELRRSTHDVPRTLEVIYRHAVSEDDHFRMLPGYRSFQRVSCGEEIAHDRDGGVPLGTGGFLLMPLYQKQGDDGFFIARRVWEGWLLVSAMLRFARAGRFVHWLPGVSRIPGEAYAYHVDRRIARLFSLQILHLLGFRRRSEEGNVLTVERRQHDLP